MPVENYYRKMPSQVLIGRFDRKITTRPEPDSNRRMTVLQTVALANLAIGPEKNWITVCILIPRKYQ